MSEKEKPGVVTPAEEARFKAAMGAMAEDPHFQQMTQDIVTRSQALSPQLGERLAPNQLGILDKIELAAVGGDFLGSTPRAIVEKIADAAVGMIPKAYPDGEPQESHYRLPSVVTSFLKKTGVDASMVENYQGLPKEQQEKFLETINATLDALDVPGEDGKDLQLTGLTPDQLEKLTHVPHIRELYAQTTLKELITGNTSHLAALQERYGGGVAHLAKAAVEEVQESQNAVSNGGHATAIAAPSPTAMASDAAPSGPSKGAGRSATP